MFPEAVAPEHWDAVPVAARGGAPRGAVSSDEEAEMYEPSDDEPRDEDERGADLLLLKARVAGATARGVLAAAEGGDAVAAADLVPGRYEGGLKLWECAVDLCEVLCDKYGVPFDALGDPNGTLGVTGEGGGGAGEGVGEGVGGDVGAAARGAGGGGGEWGSLRGARVLELGCGHALPGIVAAAGGARAVYLQDYNRGVLDAATRPNVEANLARMRPGAERPSVRYFAGDWGSLEGPLTGGEGGGPFDVVLSAETVYEKGATARLLGLLKAVVGRRGVALVAAKAYYFGVGGGSREFARAVAADGFFSCEVVRQDRDGASNIREVLALRPARE